MAYTVSEGTTLHLYLQSLNEFGARQIPESEGANNPFFSPDGQWVGFFKRDGLYKASTAGGAPVRISDGPAIGWGADWGRDGTIVYSLLRELFRVSADGGTPERLGNARDDVSMITGPQILPDGSRLLAAVGRGDKTHVEAFSLDTGEWSPVPSLEGTNWARYLTTGHLVYERSRVLWAGAFDPENLDFHGPSAPVLEEAYFASNTRAFAAVSDAGTLIYAASGPVGPLLWVDREGRGTPLRLESRSYRFPRLDRNDSRVVASTGQSQGGNSELWLLDLARGGVTRITGGDYPAWAPDGLTLTANDSANFLLQSIEVDNPTHITILYEGGTNIPGAWSADGRLFAFYKIDPGTNRDIWILSSEGVAEPFVVTPANERTPYPSPDGRFIAYVSDESGRDEVYVRSYPDTGRRWPISTNGGREPVWSADGAELFYRNGHQMVAVGVSPGETFQSDAPRVLFEVRYGVDSTSLPDYDVSKDGQRFLMVTDTSPRELRIITNWGDELSRLTRP